MKAPHRCGARTGANAAQRCLSAVRPGIRKEKALRLATVTLQMIRGLNQLYGEISAAEWKRIVKEYTVAISAYLATQAGRSRGWGVYRMSACLLLSSALMAGLLMDGCSQKSASAAGNQAPPPTDVRVVTVEQRDVPVFGDWIATLDGTVNANIQPQVGDRTRQDYREGSLVHRARCFFDIDPRTFQATLDQTLAQVAQAEGQLWRRHRLSTQLANINVN